MFFEIWPATLLKKMFLIKLQAICFPVNIAKFLRTSFSYNTSAALWLLFNIRRLDQVSGPRFGMDISRLLYQLGV